MFTKQLCLAKHLCLGHGSMRVVTEQDITTNSLPFLLHKHLDTKSYCKLFVYVVLGLVWYCNSNNLGNSLDIMVRYVVLWFKTP